MTTTRSDLEAEETMLSDRVTRLRRQSQAMIAATQELFLATADLQAATVRTEAAIERLDQAERGSR